ncbi:MAG TPA: heme-binding protein [Vicinamibacterales bacterium]|nr:heme-binding protein [Vicinamibacterales bacterium]
MKRVATALFVIAMSAPPIAWAQGTTALPIDKATVSKEVAQRTLMKNQISSTVARQIVDACLDFARNQQGGPGNYAIFVLAPNGDIVDAHVMDGVLPIGVETGLLKAKTALYARTPSSAVAQRFSDVDGRLIRLDLGKESGLAYYFVGGGLPIVVESNLIGSIGVGGGNMDEQCAYQALTKVLGPQPPLPAGRGAPGGAPPAGGAGRQGGRGN